ncbi:hypothetical protein [Saudi moumouvirus]|uniref:Uncharacterized protein n=1 Tax=Moumouvirus sp. 'Monve' TaxID=1128131 RepID=H2EFW4_9VIRU|nr:hypothetical protein mv_R814 [Moumouvirus Monve]AQN68144.1 hypothetical protein [Saudi moumouvirus]
MSDSNIYFDIPGKYITKSSFKAHAHFTCFPLKLYSKINSIADIDKYKYHMFEAVGDIEIPTGAKVIRPDEMQSSPRSDYIVIKNITRLETGEELEENKYECGQQITFNYKKNIKVFDPKFDNSMFYGGHGFRFVRTREEVKKTFKD